MRVALLSHSASWRRNRPPSSSKRSLSSPIAEQTSACSYRLTADCIPRASVHPPIRSGKTPRLALAVFDRVRSDPCRILSARSPLRSAAAFGRRQAANHLRLSWRYAAPPRWAEQPRCPGSRLSPPWVGLGRRRGDHPQPPCPGRTPGRHGLSARSHAEPGLSHRHHLVPPGLPEQPLRSRLGLPADANLLLFVGRLTNKRCQSSSRPWLTSATGGRPSTRSSSATAATRTSRNGTAVASGQPAMALATGCISSGSWTNITFATFIAMPTALSSPRSTKDSVSR